MTIQHRLWADISEDTLLEAGDLPGKVYGPFDAHGSADVVYDGLLGGWLELPTGALSLRRIVQLDEDHRITFEFLSFAKGAWSSVETDGFVFDLEKIIETEVRDKRRRAEAEALSRQAQLSPKGARPIPMDHQRPQRPR